jgi:nicotinate phosphoribosyltransferase
MRFNIATEREIRSGKTTDVYFERALEALRLSGADSDVVAEISCQSLPDGFGWGVLAGLDELIELLEGRECDLYSLPEGSLFSAKEPVASIRGRYSEIAVLETAILGLLSQASGVATKAAHFRICSRGRTLLSFGARRMHPALAPMIDRAAFLGGFDGVAVVASAERLGIAPSGTMPHSLVILVGDTLEAFAYFDEAMEKGIPRIALIDTFGDEKVEALRLARRFGRKLQGVRVDTPGSRRGNIKEIVEEMRWELDLAGFRKVKIFVSGGLDLEDVEELSSCVDGFGVGTSLSNAKVINFAMDIVQVGDQPLTKKGKMAGAKEITACSSCGRRAVLVKGVHDYDCSCGGKMRTLQRRFLRGGSKTLKSYPSALRIRKRLLDSLSGFMNS